MSTHPTPPIEAGSAGTGPERVVEADATIEVDVNDAGAASDVDVDAGEVVRA